MIESQERTVKIYACFECPRNICGIGVGSRRCQITGKLIPDLVAGFPDICPLPQKEINLPDTVLEKARKYVGAKNA